MRREMVSLEGKRGLIVGIANEQSIAYGCARMVRRLGAELALTYLNAKAERFVRPLAERLEAQIVHPLDVRAPGQLEALFEVIEARWGRLDFLIHSIAFAPKEDLHGRLVDSSAEGFALAMDISCHSFIRMARLAEPLMTAGGTLLTMSYLGAERVVEHYNVMGPVKAALETAVRYLAYELGGRGVRVHAISPGPMRTRAASGLADFDDLLYDALSRAPLHRLDTPADVGALAAFLVSDAARGLTGNIIPVDAGYHVVA